MKYVKTYEQIKNFYQSSPKYLLVSTDKHWVYNPNDYHSDHRLLSPTEPIDADGIMKWTFPTHDNMMGYINQYKTSERNGHTKTLVTAGDYIKYPGLTLDMTDDDKLEFIDNSNSEKHYSNRGKPEFGGPTEHFQLMNDITKNLLKANPEHIDAMFNTNINDKEINMNSYLTVKNPGMKQIEMLVGLYRNVENPNI